MPAINRSASEQALVTASGPVFSRRSPAVCASSRPSIAIADSSRSATSRGWSICRALRCAARSRPWCGSATPRWTTALSPHPAHPQPRRRLSRLEWHVGNPVQPAIEHLCADVDEACSAAVLDGDDVMMIAHASPKPRLQVSAQVGFRLPAVASSLGRVLLAGLDDGARRISRARSTEEGHKVRRRRTRACCAKPFWKCANKVTRWSIRRPKSAFVRLLSP